MPNNHIEDDKDISIADWLDRALSPKEKQRIAEAAKKDAEEYERRFGEYILSQVSAEAKH